jgi:tetratricopeptide (TPR) repeat protein
VIITLRLTRTISKLALLVPLLLAGFLLFFVVRQHFIIRAFSDIRYTVSPAALAAAVEMLPDSPRLNWRMAESLINEQGDFASALKYAEHAVALSPQSELYWHVLAQAQEGVGQLAEAETSMRRAAAWAPNNSEIHWALANLLVRLGKWEEATAPFDAAGRLSPSLYPMAFDLLWQVNGRRLEQLKAVAGQSEAGQLALMQFCAEQGLFEEAAQVFKRIDRQKALTSPFSDSFIGTLIKQHQLELARTVWLSLVANSASENDEATGLWNGNFERDLLRSLNHFDWNLRENKYMRCGLENGRGRNGSRALKLVFNGQDTTTLNGEIAQRLVLKPGHAHRLECYAKPYRLQTPEGPRLAVLQNGYVLASSPPVEAGSGDWQRLVVEFTAPSDTRNLNVAIMRVPKYAYDDPTSGVIWFDDCSLRAQ